MDDRGGPGGIERCPQCGDTPRDAHARGTEIVLVPCGHAVTAMAGLEVPPEELEDSDAS